MSGINRFLLDLLVYTLDRLVPESLGLSVLRDKGDSDSTMTRLSASRKSLRPDGQLRSRDGKRLLFKWEEKGAGASLDDAVEDLKRESCSLSVYFCGRMDTCEARQNQKPFELGMHRLATGCWLAKCSSGPYSHIHSKAWIV